ncbi:MAG: sulfotransferase [Chloroflexota bacterium]
MPEGRIPEFFIVGAPRCGTTYMFDYLGRHPGVYVPPNKEPNHFCTDLDSGSFLDSVSFMRDRDEYRMLFAEADERQLAGEASTWYLYSRDASANIHAARADARILIMLRDPVEMMYSLHGRRRFGGTEELPFAEALAAEEDRRHGRRLPRRPRNVKGLLYRDVARYAEQVERYLDRFGPDQVHITIFDDFRSDPRAAYASVLGFLGLPAIPMTEAAVVNAAARRRSETLQRAILTPWVIRLGRKIIPRTLRPHVGPLMDRLNAAPERRTALDPALRRSLVQELRPDVRRLGALLDRDLEELWLGDPAAD